ncbi:hypothetical protein BHE74_00026769 [Ensete ventricosum]|nr:hypothetical protein BHE74_00026769 [Ensete ventricosum]RZS20326.1 hypothetical protein BHM03_00052834 [Ensete ventricosum]
MPHGSHLIPAHRPRVLDVVVMETVHVRLWLLGSRRPPTSRRSAGNVRTIDRPGPGVGGAVSSTVEWNDILLLDSGLADGALRRAGVAMKPFIQAGPAEEVTAEGDDRLSSGIQAYVALEATGIPVATTTKNRWTLWVSGGRLLRSTSHVCIHLVRSKQIVILKWRS